MTKSKEYKLVYFVPNVILLLFGLFIIYMSKLNLEFEGNLVLLPCFLSPIVSLFIYKSKKISIEKKNKKLKVIALIDIVILALLIVWLMWPSIHSTPLPEFGTTQIEKKVN